MKKLLIALLLVFLSFGCEQDPLKGQPDSVRDGLPPSQKPEAPRAIPQDALLLETEPRVINFVEGTLGEIKFIGRTLDQNVSYHLEFLNLPEGASFDETTSILSWNVPDSVVRGYESFTNFVLKVRMITDTNPVTAIQKDFVVWVHRNTKDRPTIEAVVPLDEIIEDSSTSIEVLVRDESSYDGPGLIREPRLRIVNQKGDRISHLINVEQKVEQDANDPYLWKFNLTLDLRHQNVVSDKTESASFSLMAISHFGESSLVKSEQVVVKNRLEGATLTWLSSTIPEFVKGEKTTFTFSLFDPRHEGMVKIEGFEAICSDTPSSESDCSCVNVRSDVGYGYVNVCTLTLKPEASAQAGYKNFLFSTKTLHRDGSEPGYSTGYSYRRSIRVVDAPAGGSK